MTKQNSKSATGATKLRGNVFVQLKEKIASALPLFRKNYTYISQDVSFDGDLSALENIVLDGKMCGNICSTKQVSLGSTARFDGSIECEKAIISGNVTGSIRTTKTITVCVPATISGDLISASVQIESGVILNGKIITEMNESQREPAVAEQDREQILRRLVEPVESR